MTIRTSYQSTNTKIRIVFKDEINRYTVNGKAYMLVFGTRIGPYNTWQGEIISAVLGKYSIVLERNTVYVYRDLIELDLSKINSMILYDKIINAIYNRIEKGYYGDNQPVIKLSEFTKNESGKLYEQHL